MKKLNSDIILAFVVAFIVTAPLFAQTLTKPEALAAANAEACAAVGLSKTCADAEHLAAYCAPLVAKGGSCVDDRSAGNKVYASYAAMSASVFEPERNKAQFQRLRDRTNAAVLEAMKDPVKCLAIIAAAGKGDPTVCK